MNRPALAFSLLALWIGTALAEVPIACQDSTRPKKYQHSQDFSGELPIPDYLDTLRACLGPITFAPQSVPPAPTSAWLESERALYRTVLAHSNADLLVVPFQVQGYGLDRIERSLMTADLAYAIAAAGKRTVADPFLVARALGEGERRLEILSIEALAAQLRAQAILLGFVGHDKHHAFTLTLQLREVAATPGVPSKIIWQHDWRAMPFSDDQTPAQVMHVMLPELLRQLPLGTERITASAAEAAPTRITEPLRSVVAQERPHSASSELLDLFAALTASTDERSREREFARAVLAAWQTSRREPRVRFDEAYALMNLERRPGALAVLAGLQTPEAVTLRALLQGDLPSALTSIEQVKVPLQRMLLQISLRDLQLKYERAPQIELSAAAALFSAKLPDWQALVAARASDADPWSNLDPLVIKRVLDAAFPLPGLDADSLVRGDAVNGQPVTNDAVDMANVRHLRQAAEAIGPTQSRLLALRPTQWDLLWVLEGLSESRNAKEIYQEIDLRGQMRGALAMADREEPFFGGDPLIAAARAGAAARLAHGSAPEIARALGPTVQQAGMLAAYWAHGQSHLAARALVAVGTADSEAAIRLDAYAYDYPRRPYWIDWFMGEQEHPEQRTAFTLESLAFSRDDVTPLSQLRPGKDRGGYDSVAQSLGTRFAGNPRLPHAFSSVDARKTYEADPIPGLQAAVANAPDVWLNYDGLGGSLIMFRGDYQAAAKAYMSYPGFATASPSDPVALSNAAHGAGQTLYLAGRCELARPLLQIAADLNTGSAASLQSRQWLQALDGNYVAAASTARKRGNAYDDPTAYRDYLSLLHALGADASAWKGFSQLLATFDSPQVWVSALVGHGREGANEHAVRAWLLRPEVRGARFQNRTFAPYYAVLWSATDHNPAADLGALVEQLDSSSAGHVDADGVSLLVPGRTESSAPVLVRPSPYRAGKNAKLPPGTPVKSKIGYFADAFAALRRDDYSGAVARFVALADHYPIEDAPYGGKREAYPLAYFAYAAAKTGDAVGLESYVAGLPAPRSFDVWLAKAFFAAAHEDANTAVSALEMAFRNMPALDERPVLVQYQYAEACEWLYRDTHDPRFLNMLLDWAKRHQRIQPIYAWAYALQYAYDSDPHERRRALAFADYLDPGGAHIRKASKSELSQARAWFHDHNPFRPSAAEPPVREALALFPRAPD